MELHVDPIEGFWLAINLFALSVTIAALIDAVDNQRAVKLLNGHARELATEGTVRREALRVVVQVLLILVVIPGLMIDRPITLSGPIVALILVPVVLLVSSLLDARERRSLTVITAAELVIERDSLIRQLLVDVRENTRISQEASDHADAAYHEANSVNAKIAAQGDRIDIIGTERAAAETRMSATVDATAEEVHDIHAATVEGGGA
jgi:hypothetical protein